MSKWEIYDRLIAGIPASLQVEEYFVGHIWTVVKAGGSCGVALTVRQRAGKKHPPVPVAGRPLREAAQLVKSWDFIEASIGMAAINAYYNAPERIRGLGLLEEDESKEGRTKENAFTIFGPEIAGRKAAVIGHFPNIEKTLAPICDLSVLEREPRAGDYPDSACEYILEEQEFVFITGMTFTNKTLPRLLELIRPEAQVCLVGPSVPLSDILFSYGVTCLSGFSAEEGEALREAIRRGERRGLFRGGHMVTYSRPL